MTEPTKATEPPFMEQPLAVNAMRRDKNMIRVLHVSGGLKGGGAEVQLKLLMTSSRDRIRHAVAYLVDDTDFTDREGIDFFPLRRRSRFDVWNVLRGIDQAVRRFQPDIVYAWLPSIVTIPAALVARMRGTLLISGQRHRLGGSLSIRQRINDLLGALSHQLSQRIVTNYDPRDEPYWFRRQFVARNGVVLRNGVALGPHISPRPSFEAQPKPLRVLYVGRFVFQKRPSVLIEALAIARDAGCDVRAELIGKGTPAFEASLREKVAQLGLEDRIVFRGYVHSWQMEAKNFDILVLPSITEGMPNVVVEAMALGLPVVTTKIPEICDIVQDGEASLFEPDDVQALADIIVSLQKDPVALNELRDKGIALATHFSPQAYANAYVKLFTQMRNNT